MNRRIDLTAQASEILNLPLAKAQGKIIHDEGAPPPGVDTLCIIFRSEKSNLEGCRTGDLEYCVDGCGNW
jgi:hypothetical protein